MRLLEKIGKTGENFMLQNFQNIFGYEIKKNDEKKEVYVNLVNMIYFWIST